MMIIEKSKFSIYFETYLDLSSFQQRIRHRQRVLHALFLREFNVRESEILFLSENKVFKINKN